MGASPPGSYALAVTSPSSHPDESIRLTDVSVRRGGVPILSDVTWALPVGANAAILGPNGSGKTTLMRVLSGYLWPTKGVVDVLGERLGGTDLRTLRRHIGVVDPSDRFGVDSRLSVRDAVLTGCFGTLGLYDRPTDEQVDRAHHFVEAVGLSAQAERPVRLLSTGEHRRCLLARALVRTPKLLLLDEPTAGLDVAGREHLLATLEELRRSDPTLTVVLATHHVEEISPRAEHALLLSAGRVAAAGRPDDVIDPESLSHALGCKVFVQKRSGRFWLEVLPEAWLDFLDATRGAAR